MEWTTFFVISAIFATAFFSIGPILYQSYFDSSEIDIVIHVKDFRPRPRVKVVCGTVESIRCDICTVFVNGLRTLIKRQAPEEDIVKFSTETCIFFKIEDDRVCQGIVKMFKREFIGVVERLVLSPEEACGFVVGETCGTPYNPEYMWNVTLPDVPKPPVQPHVLPQPGLPKLRILHLTDIHLDSAYLVGANAKCGEPLCCRKGDGMAPSGSLAAGKYGTLADCDLPYLTLHSLFEHLRTIKDQFDYVLFTGDLPAHNVWNQSRSDIVGAMEIVTKLFLTYLPDKKVYNTLGNHESAPVNSFPPDYIKGKDSENWLYNASATYWSNWLPEDTMSTIRRGGYYTVLLEEGYRLISLNMNFCNNENWWLLINTTDPMGQLSWLIDILQKAEDNKEKVHIIGHIWPGSGVCLKPWSWNYYKIINRYESTISAHFFGHAHTDFYSMFYDDVTFKRPIGVLYIPGSVTTYSNINPGYRIYEVDGYHSNSSWYPLDYQNYILNLTDVNESNKPVWQHSYSAKADLGLKNLFPEEWDGLITRLKANDTLLQQYWRYSQKLSTDNICDVDCRSALLCSLRSGRSHDGANLCGDLEGYN